jgi:Cytochrome c3
MLGRTRLFLYIAILFLCVVPASLQTQIRQSRDQALDQYRDLSLETKERIEDPGWWPTKGDAAGSEYADPGACAECHRDLAAAQHETPMYKASRRPEDAEVLERHPNLTFDEGGFTYLLKSGSNGTTLTVSDGSGVESQKVAWAFGEGEVGQTYLFRKDQTYLESRVSYFTTLNALSITIGHRVDVPSTMEQAFGTPLRSQETQSCFGCHTTMSTTSNTFNADSAVPGVTCQACHGPGASHIKAMTGGSGQKEILFNPGLLPPATSVDFCGACHRTWADIAMDMPSNIGVIDVRFQPYRLEKSRCWRTGADARITCVACHDPHQPLVRDLSTYDKNCLSCHTRGVHAGRLKAPIAICKVSTARCVSCHMPKYVVPQAPASFTDHYIRVVHPGDPFPE